MRVLAHLLSLIRPQAFWLRKQTGSSQVTEPRHFQCLLTRRELSQYSISIPRGRWALNSTFSLGTKALLLHLSLDSYPFGSLSHVPYVRINSFLLLMSDRAATRSILDKPIRAIPSPLACFCAAEVPFSSCSILSGGSDMGRRAMHHLVKPRGLKSKKDHHTVRNDVY